LDPVFVFDRKRVATKASQTASLSVTLLILAFEASRKKRRRDVFCDGFRGGANRGARTYFAVPLLRSRRAPFVSDVNFFVPHSYPNLVSEQVLVA
jgi:hypothetical protein